MGSSTCRRLSLSHFYLCIFVFTCVYICMYILHQTLALIVIVYLNHVLFPCVYVCISFFFFKFIKQFETHQKKASIELEAVSTTISFINTVHTISAFQFPIHSFTHSLCFFRNYFSPNEITQSFICGGSYLKAFFSSIFLSVPR